MRSLVIVVIAASLCVACSKASDGKYLVGEWGRLGDPDRYTFLGDGTVITGGRGMQISGTWRGTGEGQYVAHFPSVNASYVIRNVKKKSLVITDVANNAQTCLWRVGKDGNVTVSRLRLKSPLDNSSAPVDDCR